MRRVLALALLPALLSACDHHVEPAGPPYLAYACSGGEEARILYEGGGDPARGRARLHYRGHSFEMTAAPAMSGLRYTAEEGLEPGRGLVWSVEGDEAAIREIAEEPHAGHEIARCTRIRERIGETPEPAADDHH